jgi:hypothetical protein
MLVGEAPVKLKLFLEKNSRVSARTLSSHHTALIMRLIRTSLCAAALLLTAAASRATTVIPPEFPSLVQTSDYVVRGVVKSTQNEIRIHNGREVPFTLATIEVSEVIAGTPPAQVVLTMLGGTTSDGSQLTVEGAPRFAVGDKAIFFVKDNGKNFYPLNSVMHGLYPVMQDKATGREYVARANGVPLAAVAEIALPMAEGKAAQELRRQRSLADALSVDEFKQSIRAVRAEQNGVAAHAR